MLPLGKPVQQRLLDLAGSRLVLQIGYNPAAEGLILGLAAELHQPGKLLFHLNIRLSGGKGNPRQIQRAAPGQVGQQVPPLSWIQVCNQTPALFPAPAICLFCKSSQPLPYPFLLPIGF